MTRKLLYQYTDNPTPDVLDALRERVLQDEDLILRNNVGHFLLWYAASETSLTMFLYWATNPENGHRPEMFNLLTRGMDCKTKVARLRAALTANKMQIPPALKARLSHMNDMADIRNHIVHGHPFWAPEEDELWVYQAAELLMQREEGKSPLTRPAYHISGSDLFERGIWLKCFARDVARIVFASAQAGTVQASSYESAEPKAKDQTNGA